MVWLLFQGWQFIVVGRLSATARSGAVPMAHKQMSPLRTAPKRPYLLQGVEGVRMGGSGKEQNERRDEELRLEYKK